jgi:Putative peptidoglycan binding domain
MASARPSIPGPTTRGGALRIAATFSREADDAALLDASSAFIRTENFEGREQERGYLDRAVLEFMKVGR